MKKKLFDDLVASIEEAGKIHRGETKASRTFVFEPGDVRKVASKAPDVVAKALSTATRRTA